MRSAIKYLIVFASMAVMASVTGAVFAEQPDGDELLIKADDLANAFEDLHFNMDMTLIGTDGIEKRRLMKVWQKGKMRMVKFLEPASERGMSVLILDEYSVFIYLPAYGKVRRVASHVRNQNFLGADLSYEDFTTTRLSDFYHAKLIETTDEHFVLELTPKPGVAVSYSKVVIKIHRGDGTIRQLDYYDNIKKELIKVEERSNVTVVQGHPAPRKITVTDLRTGHQTVIELIGSKYNSGVEDSIFTQRYMKRPER